MAHWFTLLEIRFKKPIREARLWFLPRRKIGGFYQNFGVTADTLETAKQTLLQRIIDNNPQWKDNMVIGFDEITNWSLGETRRRLATDMRGKSVEGKPEDDGIWFQSGRIFYRIDRSADYLENHG